MSRRPSEKGSALTTTLLASALLMPLGALAVLQVRSGLLIQQNLRAETEAFYAAEAGLAWATTALPIGADVATLLAGPDGVSGTADDGLFPFGMSISGYEPSPPLALDVRIESAGENLFRLTATSVGARGATRVVERLVGRAALPYAPGAVYAGGGAVPAFGSFGFVVNGRDHSHDDDVTAASGAGAGLPAIAYASAAAEAAARASLPAGIESQLVGSGEAPCLGHDRAIDLDPVMDRASQSAAAIAYDPWDLPADLEIGSMSSPQISTLPGEATIEGAWRGAGILVVRGRLRIRGSLDFDGLVIARDGLVLESSGGAHLRGALWLATGPLDLFGNGGIGYCSECLATVDSAFPTLLPHPFEPLAWREVTS